MENEQDLVAGILKAMPPPDVRGDFVARVSARIDESSGWFGVADFRLWTLRLAPAVAALALVAVFWDAPATTTTTTDATTVSATFSPASSTDWQKDVSGDDLLEAALTPAGAGNAR